MKEIIRKTFLLGLGAASMTKDQAEKVVKDLVKKNAVTIKASYKNSVQSKVFLVFCKVIPIKIYQNYC